MSTPGFGNAPTPRPFLSLPLEIRVMIYHQLFKLRIRYSLRNNGVLGILPTCKAIESEAAAVLYGGEHLKITVTNDPNGNQPYFMLNSKTVREDLAGIEGVLKHIQHVQKFDVFIEWKYFWIREYDRPVFLMLTENVLCAYHFLKKIPNIKFIHLVFNNKCPSYPAGDESVAELVACIFSLLRNVRTLVVDFDYFTAMPGWLQYMKSKMQGSGPVTPLPAVYLELKNFALHYRPPQQVVDVDAARWCLENEDMEGFLKGRAEIIASARQRKEDEWRQGYESGMRTFISQMQEHFLRMENHREWMEKYAVDMKEGMKKMEKKLLRHDPKPEDRSDCGTKSN